MVWCGESGATATRVCVLAAASGGAVVGRLCCWLVGALLCLLL